MTTSEYPLIAGVPQPAEITQDQQQALVHQAARALAVRRALAIREIEEQAAAFNAQDRQRILLALS